MQNAEPTIMRWDVMELMDTGDPCDLTYITMDRRRGTGGDIKRKKNWAKVTGSAPQTRAPGEFKKISTVSRNPNHIDHKTVNIFNPSDPRDHVAKVHWRLITHFNGKRVTG